MDGEVSRSVLPLIFSSQLITAASTYLFHRSSVVSAAAPAATKWIHKVSIFDRVWLRPKPSQSKTPPTRTPSSASLNFRQVKEWKEVRRSKEEEKLVCRFFKCWLNSQTLCGCSVFASVLILCCVSARDTVGTLSCGFISDKFRIFWGWYFSPSLKWWQQSRAARLESRNTGTLTVGRNLLTQYGRLPTSSSRK